MTANRHAFCETIAANLTHIRPLSAMGLKYGGGADTKALCGAPALWDTRTPFSREAVENWNPWPYRLCVVCCMAYLKLEVKT